MAHGAGDEGIRDREAPTPARRSPCKPRLTPSFSLPAAACAATVHHRPVQREARVLGGGLLVPPRAVPDGALGVLQPVRVLQDVPPGGGAHVQGLEGLGAGGGAGRRSQGRFVASARQHWKLVAGPPPAD